MRLSAHHRFLLLCLFFLTEACFSAEPELVPPESTPPPPTTLVAIVSDRSASYRFSPDTVRVRQLLATLCETGRLTVGVLRVAPRRSFEQRIFLRDWIPPEPPAPPERSDLKSNAEYRRTQKAHAAQVASEQQVLIDGTIQAMGLRDSLRPMRSDVDGTFALLTSLLSEPEWSRYDRVVVLVFSDLEHDLSGPQAMQPVPGLQPDWLFVVRPRFRDLPRLFPGVAAIEITEFRPSSVLTSLKP